MAVECVKLVTGEELIGEVTMSQTRESFIITNPAQIIMRADPEGKASLGMMPWLVYAEKPSQSISMHNVLTMFAPAISLRNAWSQQFGSGLVVPDLNPETKSLLL